VPVQVKRIGYAEVGTLSIVNMIHFLCQRSKYVFLPGNDFIHNKYPLSGNLHYTPYRDLSGIDPLGETYLTKHPHWAVIWSETLQRLLVASFLPLKQVIQFRSCLSGIPSCGM